MWMSCARECARDCFPDFVCTSKRNTERKSDFPTLPNIMVLISGFTFSIDKPWSSEGASVVLLRDLLQDNGSHEMNPPSCFFPGPFDQFGMWSVFCTRVFPKHFDKSNWSQITVFSSTVLKIQIAWQLSVFSDWAKADFSKYRPSPAHSWSLWNGRLTWELMTWKVKGDTSAWKPKLLRPDHKIMVGCTDAMQWLGRIRPWPSSRTCLSSFVKSIPDRVPNVPMPCQFFFSNSCFPTISPSLCKRRKTSLWFIWSHYGASLLKCFGLKIPCQS